MNRNQKIYLTTLTSTPLGLITLAANERGITNLLIQTESKLLEENLTNQGFTPIREINHHLQLAVQELTDYFSGEKLSFSTPIDWIILPPFQRKVLQVTYKIPYGEIRTYSQIAIEAGHPNAARAVGQAQARNPIPIIIPCHRVIGKDGKLHGYGAPGGIKTKNFLLRLEGAL